MSRECDCMAYLDENDECPQCSAELDRMWREYGRGNVRAAMAPPGPWQSREDIIREAGARDD